MRRAIDARLGLVRPDDPIGRAWIFRLPGIVTALAAVMTAWLLIYISLPAPMATRLDYALGLVPARFVGVVAREDGAAELAAWGPMFTHIFSHAGFWHLALNMIGLVLFGAGVARRLGADGSVGGGAGLANRILFFSFFLACGVAGGVAYVLAEPGAARALVGASGAISGVMAASMRLALRRFAPYGVAEGPLAGLGTPALLSVTIAYLGLNLVPALGVPVPFVPGGDIGWHAHIGGYLFGLLTFPFYDRLAVRAPAAQRYV